MCYSSALRFGGVMGKAQRFRLALLYGAIAVLGAAYGVFEHQQAIDWVTDSMKGLSLPLIKEVSPFFLLLILALVIYGLFRAAGSLFERLNGISLAAHNALHTNYGKARTQTV
jgi:hypothetical protein